MQPLSVNALSTQIKSVLETTFSSVYVEGEISNLTYHSSGHIYFSLKDETNAVVSCIMFRGNAKNLKFALEVGQKIIVNANLTVYAPQGKYQLICTSIKPSGVGELSLAYEQLKAKLQIKGYFNKELKKTLPRFPKVLYIVTSNTGAAIEDMKKILAHRYPLAKMILLPTLVQGNGAKENIAYNIKLADSYAQNSIEDSIIIVGRGGGSIEDLWAFNEEIVADAIFQAQTPVISAVGHESDVLISDFVADVRASTPSNAIEISVPNINDLRIYLDTLSDEFQSRFNQIFQKKQSVVDNYYKLFSQHSFERKFQFISQQINHQKEQLKQSFMHLYNIKKLQLDSLHQKMLLKNPSVLEKPGYMQVTKDEKVVDIDDIQINDTIILYSKDYSLDCKVLQKKSLGLYRF